MNNFIGQYYLKNLSICDELINLYKNAENKIDGCVGDNNKIDYKRKKSTEAIFSSNNFMENELGAKYIIELQNIVNKYIAKYVFSDKTSRWSITDNIKIQFYSKNEGYFEWHTERDSAQEPFVSRHLVFMTYLNDVEDGGETEFYYQEIKIKPRKGLTLIWPADWTHTHRGVTSPTQEKYIITGWFNFIK
jgi:hypothetical protein